MRAEGATYQAIADTFAVTRQRVIQKIAELREGGTRRTLKYNATDRARDLKRDYSKRKRQERKALVIAHYSDGTSACIKCGEDRTACLSIDHINGGGHAHLRQIGKAGSSFYEWLIKNDLPEGYQTLCMNCQWIKNAEQ